MSVTDPMMALRAHHRGGDGQLAYEPAPAPEPRPPGKAVPSIR